jgi:hypothetical protein
LGFLIFALGGWELAYDFFSHITGQKGKFSGVPMHVGHYRDAMEVRIQACNPGVAGFFSPRKWRIFIHSALALRMATLPQKTREPCCELHVIGGDGTGIGVPLRNVDIEPAWAPPVPHLSRQPRDSTINRCGIGPTDTEGTASDFEKARQFLQQVTSRATSGSLRADLRDSIDDYAKHIPVPIFRALEVFLVLDEGEPHWKDFRVILSTLSRTESLSGIITIHMLSDARVMIKRLRLCPASTSDDVLVERMSQQGMGPEICNVFRTEIAHSHSHQPPVQRPCSIAFANLLEYIGMLTFNFNIQR